MGRRQHNADIIRQTENKNAGFRIEARHLKEFNF